MKIFSAFALILLNTLLYSCSSIYMPNVPNTPMLTKQGEFSGQGHISLKGNLNLNGAYAVGNHFGVMGNMAFIDNNRPRQSFKQNLVEAAGGYFTTFGENKDRVFEIYYGLGRGHSIRVYKDKIEDEFVTTDNQDVTFSKTFLQANYSSKTKKNLRLFGGSYPLNYGTALRASYINMKNFQRNGLRQDPEHTVFLEPVFFTRLALNKAFQLQYTAGSNFGLKNNKFLTAGNSVFTVGIVLNVAGK